MSDDRSVLGVDIGGTFTDFVLIQGDQIVVFKRLSTPDDPSRALLDGIKVFNIPPDADVIHGSTVATNALLERRGARTALITTQGFADVIEIGRQNRPDLYALVPQKPSPLVPADLRIEVAERVSADGDVLIAPNRADLTALADQIDELGVESVAISLLFSFSYPQHEQQIADALRDRVFVSLSSEVLPEYREYERTSTTVINAYVAPLMDRYLAHVEAGLNGRRLQIMQSNGGVITARTARREAARTVLSGPAGGTVGAFHVAEMAGFDHVISFDMGGTSTDVALFPGRMLLTRESQIEGLPLRLPVIDIHTVGAGGGSIARVDAGGALRVGPQSAGANPGPAAYGLGGGQPTVSDANVVLGRLHPDRFLGGEMSLDAPAARSVLSRLAAEMRATSAEEAASGVIQVANAVMSRAIRTISIERGHDPREFTLVAFGGAGPLHACSLAEGLGIPRVLIPRFPGVLSALGMTIADLVKDYTQSVIAGSDVLIPERLATIFTPMEEQARDDLIAEGIEAEQIVLKRVLDMRYTGQSHELSVSDPADGNWAAAFHVAHDQRYGYRQDDEPVEVVNARLRAIGLVSKPEFARLSEADVDAAAAEVGQGPVWFAPDVPASATYYERDKLHAGHELTGPAIVFQLDATTVVPPGWAGQVDTWGNLIFNR